VPNSIDRVSSVQLQPPAGWRVGHFDQRMGYGCSSW
jgi:hypothetical protein